MISILDCSVRCERHRRSKALCSRRPQDGLRHLALKTMSGLETLELQPILASQMRKLRFELCKRSLSAVESL